MTTITRAGSSITTTSGATADRMATGWTPIVTTKHTGRSQAEMKRLLGQLCNFESGYQVTSVDNESLSSPFTIDGSRTRSMPFNEAKQQEVTGSATIFSRISRTSC